MQTEKQIRLTIPNPRNILHLTLSFRYILLLQWEWEQSRRRDLLANHLYFHLLFVQPKRKSILWSCSLFAFLWMYVCSIENVGEKGKHILSIPPFPSNPLTMYISLCVMGWEAVYAILLRNFFSFSSTSQILSQNNNLPSPHYLLPCCCCIVCFCCCESQIVREPESQRPVHVISTHTTLTQVTKIAFHFFFLYCLQ